MSDKIARLGIERDNDLMYYIKNGDVWASPRKKPGQPKGKAKKIAPIGVDLDYSKYLYFVDSDGDVARKARALGGSKRKAKAPKAAKAAPQAMNGKKAKAAADCPPCPPVGGGGKRSGKKSEAQIEAEVDELLATTKSRGKKR